MPKKQRYRHITLLAGIVLLCGSLFSPVRVGASLTYTAQSHSQVELLPGDKAISADGRYHLVHQNDGNVVLYGPEGAIWNTNTVGKNTSNLVFQSDGNLVLYGEDRALWHTATHGKGKILAVQNDSNLVIYDDSEPVWAIKGMAHHAPKPLTVSTPYGVWDRLADCESHGEWDYGPHSGWGSGIYQGGIQFHPQTWDAYKPAGYPAEAYQATREQQIVVGKMVLAAQGWRAWPACSLKLGLR